jgi:hypothetical protein
MKYPESVLTKNQKGEIEIRNLLERGEFIKYNYADPETGKIMKSGKFSIILKSDKGEQHIFLIPIKGNRFLAIEDKEKKPRQVWDGKKAVDV